MPAYRPPSVSSVGSDDASFVSAVSGQVKQPPPPPPPPMPLRPAPTRPPPPPLPPSPLTSRLEDRTEIDLYPARRRPSVPFVDYSSDPDDSHRPSEASDNGDKGEGEQMWRSNAPGASSAPKRPGPPSPPRREVYDESEAEGEPKTEATVYYKGKDGRPRRTSFTLGPNGEVQRETDFPNGLSDNDDMSPGTDWENYRDGTHLRDRKPNRISDSDGLDDEGNRSSIDDRDYDSSSDAGRHGGHQSPGAGDGRSQTIPRKKGVSFGSEVKPPAPGHDDDTSRQRSGGGSSHAGDRASSPSSLQGLVILPSITSAVKLPTLTLNSRSGVVILVLLLILIFSPKLFSFQLLPLIIPSLVLLASTAGRVNELEYMCLATIFFLDNGLLRAFLPHNTSLRAITIVTMQTVGCSRWNGRLVVDRIMRLWMA